MGCRRLDVTILSDFCVSGRRDGALKILNPGQGAGERGKLVGDRLTTPLNLFSRNRSLY